MRIHCFLPRSIGARAPWPAVIGDKVVDAPKRTRQEILASGQEWYTSGVLVININQGRVL